MLIRKVNLILTVLVLVLLATPSRSQDTLKVMSYNLLNFPNGRDDCGSNLSVPARWDTLRKIVQYQKPDILMVCELQTEAGADSILNRALNVGIINYYARASFVVNQSGFDGLNNMFFYNTQKVTLYSQSEVLTDLRDIGEYVVYANDPNLSFYNDTNFIHFYVGHLKAGNTNAPVEENRRALECDSLRSHVDGISSTGNFIFGGDFNFYTSSEPGYQILTAGGVNKFNDPINTPGNWNNNSSFADIHTQSTRSSQSIECGAPGGMDDRFDFILISDSVVNGGDKVQYINGTYAALGNDGSRFNQSINNPPNSSLPDSVISALYYMSDHLPVVIDLLITYPNVMALSTTQTEVTCNGDCDGSATATIAGGSPPFTYQWNDPSSQTTLTATGLCPGTYTFTFTDSTGTSLVESVVLTDPPVLDATFSDSSTISCSGDSSGFATVSTSGGMAPYTYLWNDLNGQTTVTATGLIAGTYTVLVTDNRSCTDSASITIVQIASTPLSVNISSVTNVLCNGNSTGSATASTSGGTLPYAFVWNDPSSQTDSIATGLTAGTFVVSVTDSAGCPGSDTAIITETPALVLTITDTGTATCGSTDTYAAVSVTGGLGTYTYLWDDPSAQTTDTATALASGIYTVTVTDSVGCYNSAQANLVDFSGPSISITDSTNVNCFGSANGSATVTPSGGAPPYTYLWAPSGSTDSTANFLTAGVHTVTVIDNAPCSTLVSVTITEPPQLTATFTDSLDVLCFGDSTGTATATPIGGTLPYTYTWSNGDTDSIADSLAAGSYTVTITDANGCLANGGAAMTNCFEIRSILVDACNPSGPEADNEMVRFEVGTADLNTAGLFVDWPNNNWDGLCQNANTSDIVDSINANITAGGMVVEPTGGVLPAGAQVMLITSDLFDWQSHDWSALNYTIYLIFQCDGNCCGHFKNGDCACATCANDRTLILDFGGGCSDTVAYIPCVLDAVSGGTDGDEVEFDDAGNPTYQNIGCLPPVVLSTPPMNITISQPGSAVVASITASGNINCFGDSTGSANSNGSGGIAPYTYLWDDPSAQSDSAATGLPAGNYVAIVTDNNGCMDTAQITVSEPSAALSSSITGSTNIICYGASTGSATASAAGGTPPYTYLWNDPSSQTNATASSMAAGSYTVLVTDANGCQDSTTATLTQPSLFTIFTVDLIDAHCGQSDGSAIVNSVGGTLPHTYLWNDPSAQTDTLATGLSAGTYTVVFTDAVGCSDSLTLVLNDLPGPGINNISSTTVTCSGDSTGTATVDAGGGTEPYTYLWDDMNAQTDSIATGLPTGTYNVSVTDNFGCQVTTSTSVATLPALVLSTSSTPANCGLTDGTATVSVTGGSPPYSYAWNTSPAQTDTTATGLSLGIYTIVVTDTNGCTDSASVGISNLGGPTVLISDSTNISCAGDSTGSATVSASGGTTPYTYLWDDPNAQTDSMATGLPAGTYTVNVADAGGCGTVVSVVISEPGALALSFTSTPAACGDSSGTCTVSVSGGIAPYNYVWNNMSAQTDSTATGLYAGTFSVTVTDDSGCAAVDSTVISQTIAFTLTSAAINVQCNGDSSGTAIVSTAGGSTPFTYAWGDPGLQTTANATGLPAGSYTVVVTDSAGCVDSSSVTVSEPSALGGTFTVTDASCNGDCDGSITASPSGGTGSASSWSLIWNTGDTALTITSLCAGTYAVLMIDSVGCSAADSAQVTEPVLMSVTATSTDASCNGIADGTLSATVTGGNAPLTYSWTGGLPPNPTHSVVSPGSYTVTVTDSSGCMAIDTVVVNEPSAMNLIVTPTPSICSNGGEAAVTVSGGTSPYTYIWDDPNGTTGAMVFVGAGTYTVTVTDANGCSQIGSTTVTNTPGPVLDSVVVTLETCIGEGNALITVYANSGIPPYTYTWDDPSLGTASTSQNVTSGVYYLIVTDAQFCGTADTVTVGPGLTDCEVEDSLNIPSSFTPNFDLTNDTWILRGVSNYPDVKVEIYNRWGSLLFSSAGYAEPWDGTYQGKEVASATYYYIIILSENDEPITGSVTVVR